ncbi:PRTRC system protein A [Novosphingobium piscinae]|uniref:PRTRC system protein A n=1 Tax=Novosphingobium piscinae TaxID=1507448 RepID=A0A7X1FXD8_9SPHN|nr:PRTRC system protein A [Novosphingobium piscinae]MBC2668740.1 PRTRC system protein A [Novosphingobium piscinae]
MILASHPTAAAVLEAVPCYPVPPTGSSPAIDALRAARAGHGLIVGDDGMMLILRRPWLALDYRVTEGPECHTPYGEVGPDALTFRCGPIPAVLLDDVLDHFAEAMPNEAAAFIVWNEVTNRFHIEFPKIDAATPSRLVYRPPVLGERCHLVCDIHSHGAAPAFFSETDNADDAHSTKIAIVVGLLGDPGGGPSFLARLCAGGMFLTLPGLPFAEVADAA